MKPALPLQQHHHYGAALQLIGATVTQQDIAGAAPMQVNTRWGVSLASRGPIWHQDTDPETQIDGLRHSKIRLINSDKGRSSAFKAAGYRQIMTPASVAELNLNGTQTDRLARTKGKWRNIWRRAQASPIKLRQDRFNAHQHDWLLNADIAQQRAKRFRALPHSIIHAYAEIRPQDVIVITATLRSDPVAAMLFLRHPPVATYHLGWSNEDGRKHGAHHAILMHAADIFAKDGLTRLDLGHVDTENSPGLARFKIGCGATVRPLGGTWLKLF